MDRPGVEIRRAAQRDVPGIAGMLAEAFSRDPVFLDRLSPRQDGLRVLAGLFAFELEYEYIAYGRVDVAVDGGAPLGAILMLPPDAAPVCGPVHRARLMRALGRSFWRLWRSEAAVQKARPVFPHWYLGYIAVTETARGRGLGSALLDRAVENAGEEAVYLESTTAASQALYERKGFVPLGAVPRLGRHCEVGMWRPGVVTR